MAELKITLLLVAVVMKTILETQARQRIMLVKKQRACALSHTPLDRSTATKTPMQLSTVCMYVRAVQVTHR